MKQCNYLKVFYISKKSYDFWDIYDKTVTETEGKIFDTLKEGIL